MTADHISEQQRRRTVVPYFTMLFVDPTARKTVVIRASTELGRTKCPLKDRPTGTIPISLMRSSRVYPNRVNPIWVRSAKVSACQIVL